MPRDFVWSAVLSGTTLSHGGFSAYRMVFGPHPVDLYTWYGDDRGLEFAQDTSILWQFTQQWKLGTMAQEATPEEAANSKIRRLLVRNKSFERPDVSAGYSVLFLEPVARKRLPRQRRPAVVLDIDEVGGTVSSSSGHSQRNSSGTASASVWIRRIWAIWIGTQPLIKGKTRRFGLRQFGASVCGK